MDCKKHLLATCALMLLVGCASQPGQKTVIMPTKDLMSYRADCNNMESQKEFLEKQKVTSETISDNRLVMSNWLGKLFAMGEGTYQQRVEIDSGMHNAIVRRKMRNYEWCIK
jgi:hypothetical protein